MASDDKKKALDAAIAKLEKDFGKGTVMKLGDPAARVAVETVPTGSLSLDIALGLGGVPRGRVIEIYGPESSGKTTVALHMISEVQKQGGIAGFIDAEHALDPVYAKNIGVNIDELYISQPDSGDQALEITETMVRSGAMDIIVVDSVAALVPRQEIEGDVYKRQMQFKKDNMHASAKNGFTNATDAADYLVNHGVPFRDAHGIVAQLVLYLSLIHISQKRHAVGSGSYKKTAGHFQMCTILHDGKWCVGMSLQI